MSAFSRQGMPRRGSGRSLPELDSQAEVDKLLVFGYQCKLFRDDERALSIDQGGHLIPWMGDASLMIDRYDGRGHLHDLKPYDAEYMSSRNYPPSEEEKVVEAACDEQRYLELNSQYLEQVMYEEEEMKRLQQSLDDGSYGAVGFSYDGPSDSNQTLSNLKNGYDDEDDEAYVPASDLQVPSGLFVPPTVKSNAVVEKTAAFISKHGTQMEIMIKTKQKDNPQFNFLNYGDGLNAYYKHMVKMIKLGKYHVGESGREQGHGDQYLHPSLVKTSSSSAPTMSMTSSKDFLKMVKDKLPAGQIANTQYAKLLSNLSKHTGRNSPALDTHYIVPPASDDVDVGGYVPSAHKDTPPPQPYFNEMYGYEVSSAELPPVPGTEPITLPAPRIPEQPPPPGVDPIPPPGVDLPPPVSTPSSQAPVIIHSAESKVFQGVRIPPPDVRPIVDKMANYVAKNGPEFEIIVRAKNDERFQFLNKSHTFHQYYSQKRDQYVKDNEKVKENDFSLETKQDKVDSRAVTFKVRSKETESTSLVSRPALLYDSSDDEDKGQSMGTDYLHEQQPAYPVLGTSSLVPPPTTAVEPMAPLEAVSIEEGSADKRQAAERLKDRLAMAAREKLTQANKEKQLQAERKRKAAMFISLLKTQPAVPAMEQEMPPVQPLQPASTAAPDPQAHWSLEVEDSSCGNVVIPLSPEMAPTTQTSQPPDSGNRPRSGAGTPAHSTTKSLSRSPVLQHRSPTPDRRRRKSRSRSPTHRKRVRRSRSQTRPRKSPSHSRHSQSRSGNKHSKRSRSPRKHSPSRNKLKHKRKSRSRSPRSKPKKSKSHRRSRSREKKPRSRSRSSSSDVKIIKSEDISPGGAAVEWVESIPAVKVESSSSCSDHIASKAQIEEKEEDKEEKLVSMEMLGKVRAMLKASREAVLNEDGGGTP